jgi:sec-independent protein translocase protein TatC
MDQTHRSDPAAEGAQGGPNSVDPSANQPSQGSSMTLLEHLEDLRRALLSSLVAALVAMALCWFWSQPLLDWLIKPILSAADGVYFHAPLEAFMTRLKIAAICGIFLVLPYIFYKFYGFIIPGLYARERKVITPLLISSTALFYLGVAFAYLIIIPKVVTFMLSFGTANMQPLIGIEPYFAFVARLCLAFGIVFELPLVILFLSLIGVVNPRMLLRTWRYALIIVAIMAALLTPPDVVSQLLMLIPVMLLYLLSVGVAIVVTRRRRRTSDDD